jgi:hypothetical protein
MILVFCCEMVGVRRRRSGSSAVIKDPFIFREIVYQEMGL